MFVLERRSPISRTINAMELPIDADTFASCESAWKAGMYIQDAFPMLNANQREFVKTGITPAEWEKMFGPDE